MLRVQCCYHQDVQRVTRNPRLALTSGGAPEERHQPTRRPAWNANRAQRAEYFTGHRYTAGVDWWSWRDQDKGGGRGLGGGRVLGGGKGQGKDRFAREEDGPDGAPGEGQGTGEASSPRSPWLRGGEVPWGNYPRQDRPTAALPGEFSPTFRSVRA